MQHCQEAGDYAAMMMVMQALSVLTSARLVVARTTHPFMSRIAIHFSLPCFAAALAPLSNVKMRNLTYRSNSEGCSFTDRFRIICTTGGVRYVLVCSVAHFGVPVCYRWL